METKTVDRLFAGFLVAFGAYIVWNALGYGYLRGRVPGPGFFPLLVGVALIGVSVVNLVRSLRGIEILEADFDWGGFYKTLGIIAAFIAFILVTPFLGMLPAGSLFVLVTAFIIEPRRETRFALKIVAVAVTFPFICYLLFGLYLRVPLIKGVFGF